MTRPSLRHRIGFAATVVGLFMAILDIQIVSASLAEVQAGLSAAPDEASWIQSSYLIAEIVMIPLSGFLSRAISSRVLFTLSCAGFTVFSAACAFAESLPAMVVARALQGFVGGAMIPVCFSTSFLLYPGENRVKVSVLISLTATLAPTIGPSLGGWLTQALSWHWLFLINLPIGAVVGVIVWLTLDIDRPEPGLLARFDWWGLLFMAGFLGTAEYVMEEGPRWGWFDDAHIAELAAVCALCGGLFLWRAFTRPEPIIQLRAFGNRNFATGCALSCIVGVGLFGLVYVLPLFFARIRGFDSMQIGETLFITGLCMFLSAPVAGRLARLLDLRAMLALGMVLFALSCLWIAQLTNLSGFWEMAVPLGLRGAALIFMFMPINQITFGTLAPAEIKNAAALYNLMRNLGGALGLAAINSVVVWRGAAHRQHLSENVTWGRGNVQPWLDNLAARIAAAQPDLAPELAALRRLQALMQREALVLAYNDVLLLMAALFLLGLPCIALVARPRAAAGGGH
ncbi:DHA2 family efflux MFS transporter permease subunit [Belnapia sp. T6]|uniref:DHA2 family efflux MFS transporter permease subunit n=1 Tax=Belnapia mucosa TaxID=2804532 RepID=A0ABS1V8A3_9PROT|nr:DHA2 family efflux MFS transporter permease subunit [Belnapia mucosa]MBL6457901.1 DHA2 family efflux MFS transporter permease subunit [Belnapia mucosa]